MKISKVAVVFVAASLELGSSLAVAQKIVNLPQPVPRPTVALKQAPKSAAHLPSFITRIAQNFEAKENAATEPSYYDPALIRLSDGVRISYAEIMMEGILQADLRRYDKKLSIYCKNGNAKEPEAVQVCGLYSGWLFNPVRQVHVRKRFAARGLQA